MKFLFPFLQQRNIIPKTKIHKNQYTKIKQTTHLTRPNQNKSNIAPSSPLEENQHPQSTSQQETPSYLSKKTKEPSTSRLVTIQFVSVHQNLFSRGPFVKALNDRLEATEQIKHF